MTCRNERVEAEIQGHRAEALRRELDACEDVASLRAFIANYLLEKI
jgi:hypothetical protein